MKRKSNKWVLQLIANEEEEKHVGSYARDITKRKQREAEFAKERWVWEEELKLEHVQQAEDANQEA